MFHYLLRTWLKPEGHMLQNLQPIWIQEKHVLVFACSVWINLTQVRAPILRQDFLVLLAGGLNKQVIHPYVQFDERSNKFGDQAVMHISSGKPIKRVMSRTVRSVRYPKDVLASPASPPQ